jgi:phage head maturation protease
MPLIHKALDFQVRQVGNPEDRTLEFIGSTAAVDRYGDIIEVAGWDLQNYFNPKDPSKGNPVFLWAHNSNLPPLGKAVSVKKTADALVFQIKFASREEYGQEWPAIAPSPETIYNLYLNGYLRATSVGFSYIEREPIIHPKNDGRQTGWRFLKQELYELSAVPVPANPEALMLAVQKGIVSAREIQSLQAAEADAETKGVIPFKEYPADDPGAAWDGPAEIKAADVATLKTICAWFDSAKPDDKGSYKLPHHRADSKKVVWKGVTAAMARLLQPKTEIPESDRQGVYNHLAREYARFDKTPPEFKVYNDTELRLIELGLPPDVDDIARMLGDLQERLAQAPGVGFNLTLSEEQVAELKAAWEGAMAKAGAVLNAKNKEALTQARDLISQVLAAAESSVSEGKGETSNQSIYSLALNPGPEPPGGRPAGDSFNLAEILEGTKELHQMICPAN